MSESTNERKKERMNELTNEQMNKRTNERTIEQINDIIIIVNVKKRGGKGAGVSSSVLEWGQKGGTGSVQLEKKCEGIMRHMARQGQMMMKEKY